MRAVFVVLLFVSVFSSYALGAYVKSWLALIPWKKVVPDGEYGKRVELRLINKDWMPGGVNIPRDKGVLPKFPGTVEQAFKIFMKGELYKFESRHLGDLDKTMELLTSQYGYDPSLDTVVAIHTISGDSEDDSIKNIVAALALRNMVKNYNVFTLNMPDLIASMQNTIARSFLGMKGNFYALGTAIGDFFNHAIKKGVMKPDQINLIGFCYSSQLAGYISRHIAKHNDGQKIRSIIALDPYSLGFSSVTHDILTKDDAQTVYAYHTNSAIFGTTYRTATVDVTFNNGNFQPACLFNFKFMCSHRRSVLILWYVILYKDKFSARYCGSYKKFSSCSCKDNPVIQLSFPVDMEARGRYVVKTSSRKPYGLGKWSAECRFDPKAHKESEKNNVDEDAVFNVAL